MNPEDTFQEAEKAVKSAREGIKKSKSSIKKIKKILQTHKIEKLSKTENQLLEVIVLQAEFSLSTYESLLSTRAYMNNLAKELSSISRMTLDVVKQVFSRLIFIIFLVGYRKELGDLVSSYVKFAVDGWPQLSLDTKYEIVVIAIPMLIIGAVINKYLFKKHKK